MARVLLDSAKCFHPDATLYICLADRLLPDVAFYPDDCTVVPIEDLNIPDFSSFAFRYEIMEINTAVKPFMFKHLLRKGHQAILYFDPDIQIFSRVEQVLEKLRDGASFALTPHLCRPVEGDGYPDDIGIMRAGIYNLGFLGVRACPEANSLVSWWARRLEYQCINDQDAGIFVDQKFIDLVPAYCDHVCILRDPTVNVGYWNLPQRELSFEDGIWRVDGRPLCFFHFSGFSPNQKNRLSKHTENFRGSAITPALRQLMQQYAKKLRANHHGRPSAAPYAYGHFSSGTPIPSIVRKMFRDRHITWSDGNPFETYESFLHLPMPGQWSGSSSAIVTNLMGYLHTREPWLQQAFDLSQEAGVRGFVEWFLREGELYLGDHRLIEPVASRAGFQSGRAPRCPPISRSRDVADIDVIGYFQLALGVGEVGRLILRSLNHAGLRAWGLKISLNCPSKQNDRSCDHLLATTAGSRFQLFSVNCDQLLQVIDHLKPALRPDAYRIITPFWELSNLPDAWLPAIDAVDEIWAPTRFIQTTLVKKVCKPILHMPVMLDFGRPPPINRRYFHLPERSFLFFFAFDYFSYIERKNPLAAVHAFKRAFGSAGNAPAVSLVVKTMNAENAEGSARALHESLLGEPDVILIEKTLTRDETLALISLCDAVISLHRSEGLGLLVAEAMVLGKPVIATDYSATTELVTPDTGWPVDCSLVPVQEGAYPFHEGQVWADPDIDHAAWHMRQVVENEREVAHRVGRARAMISREYGTHTVASRQLARLKLIDAGRLP